MKQKAAIVGAGFMGWVHTEALRRLSIPVTGILGSTPEKSKAAASQLSLGRAYMDFNEILEDPEATVLHLCVPNRLHFEYAQRAILAGKHVMCEKPLAMNSEESQQLCELAAGAPRQACGVNYNIRFYALAKETRDLVQRGEIGRVFHVTGSYVQDWLIEDTDYNWRVDVEQGGELRAVADIGTHWLDLVQFILKDEITEVAAELTTVHSERKRPIGEVETFSQVNDAKREVIRIDTEDFAVIMLRFASGASGVVHVSQVTAGRKNCLRFEIAGSKAAVAWNSETANELWIGKRHEANHSLIRDPALLSTDAASAAGYPGGHNEGYPDSFKFSFKSFYDYIDQGVMDAPPPFATFADGHREVLLCEAVRNSSRDGGTWTAIKENRSCN